MIKAMTKELIETKYRYANVELISGAVVTANEVTIAEGKISSIVSAVAKIGGKILTFSVFGEGENRLYNMQNVPEGVDGKAVIKEFINLVESNL